MRFVKPGRGGGILRVTLLAGLILFVLACVLFAGIKILDRISSKARQDDSFYGLLREYDISAKVFVGTEREFEKLNSELNRLEKRAIGVESWLSILKRRRALARAFPPAADNYRESIKRALKAYPSSQPLAAIAAAAVIRDTAVNRESEDELRGLLPLLDSPSFNTLRLGLHILLGDFRSPERAAKLPENIFTDGTEAITADLIIAKILRADYRAAASELQIVINSPFPPSDDLLRLAAEYYFDFGDLGRSAELFSRIDGEAAMVRQADALYLAGFYGSARAIWSILAGTENENSLYNLAVTSENRDDAAFWLEKIVKSNSVSNKDSRQFGLIRYSRLLPYNQAIAILENAQYSGRSIFPYIDLEICKRHSQGLELRRQMAETWLLLDRHGENQDLHQWAAWFTFFQRFFDEEIIFLNRIEKFEYEWGPFYEAVLLMQEGKTNAAESVLMEISAAHAGIEAYLWPVYANLGRIIEADFSPSRALEQYELAAAFAQNPKTASKIQVRIAKCFSVLDRLSESRRALEYALDLDPDNLNARLELDRLWR